jgi:hypothetical protein
MCGNQNGPGQPGLPAANDSPVAGGGKPEKKEEQMTGKMTNGVKDLDETVEGFIHVLQTPLPLRHTECPGRLPQETAPSKGEKPTRRRPG